MRSLLSFVALLASTAASQAQWIQPVSERMEESRTRAMAGLRNYTVLRHYVLKTGRHSAEMMVRVTYTYPGIKQFELIWESGSNIIQKRVFRKLLEAEQEAARGNVGFTAANYQFQPQGMETVGGRRCYVLGITPRSDNKYLVRGRLWVDAADFSVVRVEGVPADTGSFWIRSSHLVQSFRKVGQFWLPAINYADSDVRLFGAAHLTIENLDYRINDAEAGNRAEAFAARPTVE